MTSNKVVLFMKGTKDFPQCGFSDIVKQVCKIVRTEPRWEQTLLSNFLSFNFTDPLFFREVLKNQNNVLLSFRFYVWLHSNYGFSPDSDSCNALFDSLIEAKACKAAMYFLDNSNYSPNPSSLERYIQCLCEGGLIGEALGVFANLKDMGVKGSIKTWNSLLFCSIKVKRTDLVWKLYQDMIESGVVVDVDAESVGYLIQAFCSEGKVSNGYELLQQVLEEGLKPRNVIFNKLISEFFKEKNYGRVSQLLHTMIARMHPPGVGTYGIVIKGLCESEKTPEGYRVFNDLKERGYALDRVMYAIMIDGLCKMGYLRVAKKLWFEMINKGIFPNEYTYNALIHGYCKIGNLKEAKSLFKEMCGKGYRETTVSYNILIAGLCLHGRTNEAYLLLGEMTKKGVARDMITYNTLIKAFCKERKIVDGLNLLEEMLAQGLLPSTYSYTLLIRKLCQVGDVQDATSLWNDMYKRGLEPFLCTHDYVIAGLCKQGFVTEGVQWLKEMLKSNLQPRKVTFERLLKCLSQGDRLDDILLVVEFMIRTGFALNRDICHSLVTKFCVENSNFIETCLGEILEGYKDIRHSRVPLLQMMRNEGNKDIQHSHVPLSQMMRNEGNKGLRHSRVPLSQIMRDEGNKGLSQIIKNEGNKGIMSNGGIKGIRHFGVPLSRIMRKSFGI